MSGVSRRQWQGAWCGDVGCSGRRSGAPSITAFGPSDCLSVRVQFWRYCWLSPLPHVIAPPPPTGQPPTARLGEEREAQCATGLRARWPPNLTSTRAIRHVLLIRSDNVPPSPAGHRQCGRHSVVVIMSAKRKMGSIPKVSRNYPLSHLFTAEPVIGVVLTSLFHVVRWYSHY